MHHRPPLRLDVLRIPPRLMTLSPVSRHSTPSVIGYLHFSQRVTTFKGEVAGRLGGSWANRFGLEVPGGANISTPSPPPGVAPASPSRQPPHPRLRSHRDGQAHTLDALLSRKNGGKHASAQEKLEKEKVPAHDQHLPQSQALTSKSSHLPQTWVLAGQRRKTKRTSDNYASHSCAVKRGKTPFITSSGTS